MYETEQNVESNSTLEAANGITLVKTKSDNIN